MPTNADSICRKVGEKFRRRLYTLSHYILEQNHLGSHLLKHWRTHTLRFRRKPNHISIQWLRHPNPNHILLQCRSIPCLKTLVGSVRYLITLLKYTLFYYIVELYPILTHCWGIPYLFTLLSNSQFQYLAELYPIPAHCWGLPNIDTLLRYTLSYNIVELWLILIYCCHLSRNVVDNQSESSIVSADSTIKNWPD